MLLVRHGRRQPRRGAAAVEFAIILAVILMPVLLGTWEVGCMVDTQQLMQNAAREGARRAASGAKTNSEVQTVVLDYLRNAGVSVDNATVTVEDITTSVTDVTNATQMDRIRVTVKIPFKDFCWIGLQSVTGITELTGQADWYCLKDRDFPALGDPAIE